MREYVFGIIALCLCLCVAAGCTLQPEPDTESPPGPGAAEAEYVGQVECASCHEEIVLDYQAHGMARSFYRLTPENAVEDFSGVTVYHEATDFYYRPFREGDRFYQEEYRLDAAGRKVHSLVREMHFVYGSGSAARTYVTAENGRYYELPLTWYTQKGLWAFSPGYDDYNQRFSRTIADRCVTCHNGAAQPVPFTNGKYEETLEPIGCEKCHGPGSVHVDARLSQPEPADSVDYTIVNPKHLPLDRRLDVCQQCHLHGSVVNLREGEGAFDFRPGDVLDEHLSIFVDESPETDEISVISHASRMQQSACFIATRNTERVMDCVTCHNPHEGFREQGAAYFNSTCTSCHVPETLQERFTEPESRRLHVPDQDCSGCHMPRVEASNAPHASFTDHWIRVVEEQEGGSDEPLPAHETELRPYFERDQPGRPGADQYRALAYLSYGWQKADTTVINRGIEQAQAVLTDSSQYGEAHFQAGYMLEYLGRSREAVSWLETAVRLGPDIPERLAALARAYTALQRDPARIRSLYERALSIQPALATVRTGYGRFLQSQGQLDQALAEFEQALAEEPNLTDALAGRAGVYYAQNRLEEAEVAYQDVLGRDPGHVEALSNMASMVALQQRYDEARGYFERALEQEPRNVTVLFNLGTLFLIQNRPQDGIAVLERVVAIDADHRGSLENLAVAQFRLDNRQQARRYAERLLALDPGNQAALQIMAQSGL